MISLKPLHDKSYKIIQYFPDNKEKDRYIYFTSKKYKNEISNDFNKDDLENLNYNKLLKKIKKTVSDEEFYKIRSYILTNTQPLKDDIKTKYDNVKNLMLDNNRSDIKINNGTLELLPYNIRGNMERLVYYISGPSGVGKSYLTANIVRRLKEYYKKHHKMNKNIYMFSVKNEDKAFDDLPDFYRLSLQDLVDQPLELEDINNSICIFDDCDVFLNKAIEKAINYHKELILEVGRSHNIDCFITSHITSNYNKTKIYFNEMHCKIVFPNLMSYHNLRYLLVKLGLPKDEIKTISELPTEWIKIIPKYKLIIYEKGAYLYD
jgi:hypothetical protein